MGTTTSITTAAPFGTMVYARVRASNAAGAATSNEIALTLQPEALPQAPVLNEAVVSGSNVNLSWTPAIPAAPFYLVLARAVAAGPVIASIAAASSNLTAPDVPPGTYHVSVVALGTSGQNSPSNTIIVTVH